MSTVANFEFRSVDPISPWLEMGAYEALWDRKGASFRTIAESFENLPHGLPSHLVEPAAALAYADQADKEIRRSSSANYGVRVHGAGEYPSKIRVAKHPVELLYYQGYWALSEQPSVSVVGTREPTPEGTARAKRIAEALVAHRIIPVAGLAKGIDSIVHETAIKLKFPTIAVIGTPISVSYPKENRKLQEIISKDNLLISQVPVLSYRKMPISKTRTFFPERNVTMSALTDATIIVEAGETSGTLTQARAALSQGRPLLILESLFNRPDITWPTRFEELGAIRISGVDDIIANVSALYEDR